MQKKNSSELSPEVMEWMKELTEFEKDEIDKYSPDSIYYTGNKLTKISATCLEDFHGVDGHYKLRLLDHINYRYEILNIKSTSTYAQVVEAKDYKEKSLVAIKIMKYKDTYHRTQMRETQILHLLKTSTSIVRIFDSFIFRDHPCIVMENLHTDLLQEMRSNNMSGMHLKNIKEITRCIINALLDLNRLNIIHGDLKPANIALISDKGHNVKLIDFGLSTTSTMKPITVIQSQPYRAPEVLFRMLPYSLAVDMWSLGCILVELFTGKSFLPGLNCAHQIALIAETINLPPRDWIENSATAKWFFKELGEIRFGTGTTLDDVYEQFKRKNDQINGQEVLDNILNKCEDHEFTDFVKKCLMWDPTARITVQEASHHKWVSDISHNDGAVGGAFDNPSVNEKDQRTPSGSSTLPILSNPQMSGNSDTIVISSASVPTEVADVVHPSDNEVATGKRLDDRSRNTTDQPIPSECSTVTTLATGERLDDRSRNTTDHPIPSECSTATTLSYSHEPGNCDMLLLTVTMTASTSNEINYKGSDKTQDSAQA